MSPDESQANNWSTTTTSHVKAPWYMIGIDYIGPVSPEAEDGSKYILTVSDYFTKWVEAIPTIDNKAVTVAAVLFKASVV